MKLHNKALAMGLLLILASVVAGCAPLRQVLGQDAVPSDKGVIAGTDWTLTQIDGEPVPEKSVATLTFTEDQVNGVAFCNSYFGDYTRDGDDITFGPLVQTEKFCMEPEGVMDLERDYLQALSVADTFSVAQGALTFYDAEGRALLVLVSQGN